jgi:hypothetical protein
VCVTPGFRPQRQKAPEFLPFQLHRRAGLAMSQAMDRKPTLAGGEIWRGQDRSAAPLNSSPSRSLGYAIEAVHRAGTSGVPTAPKAGFSAQPLRRPHVGPP